MKQPERFPLHNTVLASCVFEISDSRGKVIAEVAADSSHQALSEARAHWPQAWTAIIKRKVVSNSPMNRV